MIAPEFDMFAQMFDMFAQMFDVFAQMFDVIVDEVKKYSANARKLEVKADKQCERLDVIAILQVKTKSEAVKPAARLNLQR